MNERAGRTCAELGAHCWHRPDRMLRESCCRCPAIKRDQMIVMISNGSGIKVGLLAARHPGRLGHLYSPGGERGPYREMPFGLDNDEFSRVKNNREWDEAGWRKLLTWALLSGIPPEWALVPDVFADRDATLRKWERYEKVVREHGFRRAFAVQNGMTFGDVPDDECVLFLAGDDAFKDAAIAPWCARFPGRVHVARVNGWDRLMASYRAGAISVDGTGWFNEGRGGYSQAAELRKFLRETETRQ